ncbi:major capsid protein [Pantoea sp. MBD-2R]|uniref:major capsid protein n=1 Tax=Pantoea sp. MBD-2R TaxID=3141540 RepID=UPI003182EA0D
MATLSGKYTLLDVAKTLDPNGGTAAVAELLNQSNEMLNDMPWYEGNLPTGHRITTRTGLPDVFFRKINAGVPPSKASTAQIDEACGILEARSEIDKDLAMLNGNTGSFRLLQATSFLEAMNQRMQNTILYGDVNSTPEAFTGLGPRFGAIAAGGANKANIIDAGGTGSNLTSIWLVGWGANTVHGIYPKGSKAGLIHNDLGEGDGFDAEGKRYRAYMDQYQWKCGIALHDWRYVVRIANIDTATLSKNASAGADVIDLMTQAAEKIHSLSGVTPVYYGNRTIGSILRRQTVNKVASGTLTYEDVGGRPATVFSGIPFRRIDALNTTESRIV